MVRGSPRERDPLPLSLARPLCALRAVPTPSCGLAEAQSWHCRGAPGLRAPHGHGIAASTQIQHPELCQPRWLWHGSAETPTAAGAGVALPVSPVTAPVLPAHLPLRRWLHLLQLLLGGRLGGIGGAGHALRPGGACRGGGGQRGPGLCSLVGLGSRPGPPHHCPVPQPPGAGWAGRGAKQGGTVTSPGRWGRGRQRRASSEPTEPRAQQHTPGALTQALLPRTVTTPQR